MKKERKSILDPYAEQLEEWFEEEKIGARQAQKRLAKLGLKVSYRNINYWWSNHQDRRLQRELLDRIGTAAQQCEELERAFGDHPAPAIELLLKTQRVLALQLSNRANVSTSLIRLIPVIMRPVFEWLRLEEQRKQRELAERKYNDQAAAQQAAAKGGQDGVTPDTLRDIENKTHLI